MEKRNFIDSIKNLIYKFTETETVLMDGTKLITKEDGMTYLGEELVPVGEYETETSIIIVEEAGIIKETKEKEAIVEETVIEENEEKMETIEVSTEEIQEVVEIVDSKYEELSNRLSAMEAKIEELMTKLSNTEEVKEELKFKVQELEKKPIVSPIKTDSSIKRIVKTENLSKIDRIIERYS
jgi:predicted nuclease with TOPRIM domain